MRIRRTPRKHPLRRRRKRGRKGAAVVEFAVVSPVLILLLLGIFESGRMVMVQQSLTTAAREGARAAIVEGTSTSAAIAVVESFLAGAGVSRSTVTVTPNSTASVAHGQPITVSVSVPFAQVSWLPRPLFFRSTMLSSTATMRRETPR